MHWYTQEAKAGHQVSSSINYSMPCCLGTGSLPEPEAHWLGWVVSKVLGSASLCFCNDGVAGMHTHD